ncbi:MAG: hypothetical protein AB199_02040 [Parcubacteria bacterium C7867-004]|nr:MAG: hypothetical protein AB199_02040 [Parcubacteria bacterium C7867-004]
MPQPFVAEKGPLPSETVAPQGHLQALLEENLAVAKDNNRLLRLIRRDAMLNLIAKIVIWMILLGVPLFFLGTYIGPLLDAFSSATSGQSTPGSLPSKDQLNTLLEEYKSVYQ